MNARHVSRQVSMLAVSCDGWSFSGLAWTFKFPKFSTQRPEYGSLGHFCHLPVHLCDQHMIT